MAVSRQGPTLEWAVTNERGKSLQLHDDLGPLHAGKVLLDAGERAVELGAGHGVEEIGVMGRRLGADDGEVLAPLANVSGSRVWGPAGGTVRRGARVIQE